MQYYIRRFRMYFSASHDLVTYTGRTFFVGTLYYNHRTKDIVGTPIFEANIGEHLDTIKVEKFII